MDVKLTKPQPPQPPCPPPQPQPAPRPAPKTDPLIAPFWGWSDYTPTIPKLYWDVKSQEQRILNLFDLLNKLINYADELGVQINVNHDDIVELREEFNKLVDGEFWDIYEQKVSEWINANLNDIITQAIKQVYFGLTDDGYFCAYIPKSWSEVMFDTGAVYGRSDYGCLILRFDVEGKRHIDNTYSYSLNRPPARLARLIADIELATRRTDSAFDTLFTNISETVNMKGAKNV